jgi:hypothetical protein
MKAPFLKLGTTAMQVAFWITLKGMLLSHDFIDHVSGSFHSLVKRSFIAPSNQRDAQCCHAK